MTSDLHARFAELHAADAMLLLPNAWDAASARLWEDAGAAAIATSSAAVAWSRGYADGGALPVAALLDSLRDIVRVTSVPVTADLEHGYSDDPDAVATLVAEVVAAGAIGINLEDGDGAPDLLVAKLRAIRARLGARPCFVNARTDVYLGGFADGDAAVAMTIERLTRYRDAGADGGFVPGLASTREAAAIAAAVPLVLNLMARPGLPPIAELRAAGVRRLSVGPGLFKIAFGAGLDATRALLGGDLARFERPGLDYATLNALFADH